MRKSFQLLYFLLALCLCQACGIKDYQSSASPITHELWDSLLQKHVKESGEVNYKGFIQDSSSFNKYLLLLQQNHGNDRWTKAQQLAYWINVYNAFTVKLIVDNYPTESIKDIKKGIPFINSVWDIKFIKIEGITYDLNNIEHDILRKKYEEPRIHFAINCASISCPRLRNEAFTAEKLEQQLLDQTKHFLRSPIKNKITANRLELSKIFKWFGSDFKKKGSLIDFLNQYSTVKINSEAKIDYMDYDWNLNE